MPYLREVPNSVNLDHKIKPLKYDDETLSFDDGSFVAFNQHVNTYSWNYPDFTSLDDTGFFESEFDHIHLEEYSGGFRINGFAVNCYSDQNGYYSNDVDIFYYTSTGELQCYLCAEGKIIP